MTLFEKNTGKKIKTIALIFFIGSLIYCLIYLYQGLYAIAEVGHLIQQGFVGQPISYYVGPLVLGIIPRIAFVLLSFLIYGFGKMVENSDRLTEHFLNNLEEIKTNKENIETE